MTRNKCSGPRLRSYEQNENPSIFEMFRKLLGVPGSPTYRPYGRLPYFEKLEVGHTTVCNDKGDDAAEDPPHL